MLLWAEVVRKLLQLAPLPACRGWCWAAQSMGTALLPEAVAQLFSHPGEKTPTHKCPNSHHIKVSINATISLQTSPHGHSFCTITKSGIRCWHSWRAGLSATQHDHPTEGSSHHHQPQQCLHCSSPPPSARQYSEQQGPAWQGEDLNLGQRDTRGQYINLPLCPQAHQDLQPKGASVSTRHNSCELRTSLRLMKPAAEAFAREKVTTGHREVTHLPHVAGRKQALWSFISILLTSNTHPLHQAANFKALKKHFSLFILTPTRTPGSGGSQLPAPCFTWDTERASKASLIPGV